MSSSTCSLNRVSAKPGACLVVMVMLTGCGGLTTALETSPPPDAGPAAGPDATDVPLAVADATPGPGDLPAQVPDAHLPVVDAQLSSVDTGIPLVDAGSSTVDTRPTIDLPAAQTDVPMAQCRALPSPTINGDGGRARWVWLYDPQVADLRTVCASYGSRAMLILEVVVNGFDNPRAPLPYCTASEVELGGSRPCSVADAFRFVAQCEASDVLVELPTNLGALAAYVHIESLDVTSSPRQKASVDPDCDRHLVGGLLAWPSPAPDGGFPRLDAAPAPDTADGGACSYPSTSRVDGTGQTLWWFDFDWRQDDLADICASYGVDAKMVVELQVATPPPASTLPACTLYEVLGAGDRSCAFGSRLETDCLAGQLTFEAASQTASGALSSLAYFHIESPQVPDSPRRMLVGDTTCPRSLHPRFVPMVPAGNPDVGVDTAPSYMTMSDPSTVGQPCQVSSDCPQAYTVCFIDAAVTDCLSGPIGRCLPWASSNCVAWPGCACTKFPGGTICGDAPGTSCGNIYPWGTSPAPTNPQSNIECEACLPSGR